MTALSTIPGEILIYEILPKLGLDELFNLCETDKNFASLCSDDLLWQIKTERDYPDYYNKSLLQEGETWRDYYIKLFNILTRINLPLYHNGDIIGYIKLRRPFTNEYFESSMKIIIRQIEKIARISGPANIVFINNYREPIINVKYPQNIFQSISSGVEGINKILIIFDEKFTLDDDKMDIQNKESLVDRGSIRNNFKFVDESQERYNASVIYENLTSQYSKLPIFGLDENGKLRIIDKTKYSDRDPLFTIRGKICTLFKQEDLKNMLWKLYRFINPKITQGEFETMLRGIQRLALCEKIREALGDIGHII